MSIEFYDRGKEFRTSAKTAKKREAEKILSFYLSEVAQGRFRGFHKEQPLTVSEMLDDLIRDRTQHGLRDIVTLKARIRILKRGLGKIDVAHLTGRQIDLYVKKRQDAGIAGATLNCEMAYLAQAFKLAQRKKLLDKALHVPRFKVDNARQGFFERDDFERVIAFLPSHLRDFAWFGYLTGWRIQEIATLEWRDIAEGTIRLRPAVSKNAEGRMLVVVGELAEIIERREADRQECPYVFHRYGKRIQSFYKAWRAACTQATIPDRLFHDLRRTAVRNMIRAGVPERIAMAISGHKTRSIFDRYNIVNEEDIGQGLTRTQQYIFHRNTDNTRTRKTLDSVTDEDSASSKEVL